MCPSYRATGEEQHSTRGRARLLFEMANGQVIEAAGAPDVAEALDLCFSCKGCKRDCPVGVDMAAYKTEFLAQRYRRRPRPARTTRWARCPAGCGWWGGCPRARSTGSTRRLAARLAALVKRLGGIAPERQIPPLARRPFTRWGSRSRGDTPALRRR